MTPWVILGSLVVAGGGLAFGFFQLWRRGRDAKAAEDALSLARFKLSAEERRAAELVESLQLSENHRHEMEARHNAARRAKEDQIKECRNAITKAVVDSSDPEDAARIAADYLDGLLSSGVGASASGTIAAPVTPGRVPPGGTPPAPGRPPDGKGR